MNFSRHQFTLDIHTTVSQVVIPVSYMDTAVKLNITLTDGGRPYKIAEGCKAIFFGKKSDGTALMTDCTIQGNTICYTFTKQTATALGEVKCEIRLYGQSELILTSPSFVIFVAPRVVKDDDVLDSSDEVSALDNVFQIAADVENKLNSGEFNGKSAYQLACDNGFDGTEEEWLASLKGDAYILTDGDRSDIAEIVKDDAYGDLEEALDQIIQIQNDLINGSLEYELGTSINGDSYYIVRGIGTYKSSHLVIPDTHRGIVVSEIAENAFQGNLKLTSAVIGKNILTVGKCAFEGCSNLTSIQLTKERLVYDMGGGWIVEECYGQTDTAIYSRLASDSDPATVANLWTITQDEADIGTGLEGDIYTTDAWYWAILPW